MYLMCNNSIFSFQASATQSFTFEAKVNREALGSQLNYYYCDLSYNVTVSIFILQPLTSPSPQYNNHPFDLSQGCYIQIASYMSRDQYL